MNSEANNGNTRRSTAIWAMAVAAVLVGTTGTAQALGPSETTPIGVGAARGVIGAIALWVLVPAARRWKPRGHRGAIAIGSIGVATYQGAFFVGVDRLGVALGTVLAIGSGPMFAGALAAAVGRRPTLRWLIGTTIAIVGGATMIWASSGGNDIESGSVTRGVDTLGISAVGVAAALAAGFGYALYTTMTESLGRDGVDPTAALTWQFTIGSLVLIPLLVSQPLAWIGTAGGLILAVYLGVVTIAVAYVLVGFAVPRLGAPMVTTVFQIEPLTASVLAVVVLGERLPPVAWIGAAAIVVGITLAGTEPRPAVASESHSGADR